jgi:hypothetical protein
VLYSRDDEAWSLLEEDRLRQVAIEES